MNNMRYVRIPVERIGVLIGPNGKTKHYLQEKTNIKITIDSELGEVIIHDEEPNQDDPLLMFKLEKIIRAIGRGFSPEHAFYLFKDDMDLYIFDIHDYVGKRKSHVLRLKSRVIGREGKTKRVLEQLTDSYISIYGHTIAVIADFINMDFIKKAIDKLLSGSKHATVYRYLETQMKKLRLEQGFS